MSKEISLLDHCQEECRTTIKCAVCEIIGIEELEALEAIDEFYDCGWRVRKGVCYCPSCSAENGLIK